MNIDWSKAPEGTQAAYPGDEQMYSAWYRMDRYGCVEQICEAAGCLSWTNMGGRRDFPVGHVLRPNSTTKEAIDSMTEKDWEIIGLKATVAQQAKMIEHLRGGPTPLYTAVDMANAARDGFRDGADSFKIRGEVLMEIFHDGGPTPFICAIHGCICLEQVEAAQKDFRENMPDELEQGEGIYTFSFYYEKGQYDEYGRCEIAPGWGFDFVSYKAFEAEEVQA